METISDIDHLLPLIGELGLYQILVIGSLSLTMVAATYQMLIMYFAVYNPSWQCVNSSLVCNMTGAITSAMKTKYSKRCNMERKEWEYTEAPKFSVVTEVSMIMNHRICFCIFYHISRAKKSTNRDKKGIFLRSAFWSFRKRCNLNYLWKCIEGYYFGPRVYPRGSLVIALSVFPWSVVIFLLLR